MQVRAIGKLLVVAERPDVQHSLVAIDFLPPQVLQAHLSRLAFLLAAGRVAPLQQLVYSFADTVAAFRQFSHARHVGKIVVRVPAAAEVARQASGCWAISGGMGALGALVADWLTGQGQAYIILLGRSGR